ncbi:malonate decarboxylase holo-[acyl-carrier-protein] synthase [Rhizobium paknamense]|uniref:Phosphoribosyl-dephospho-CoA transferase n=1 Tax=Rhizobium paknamense TaxID=1206817 RepID=A0ABU0IBP7_9HYPH|nr:malonate decarboxylase holo-[acyl-carrier-protein] synthase [Rhizobium paknamense]MDQ0455658.1 phosphoribosyl-dephospho-CoA transferase [Rhizobium paknamense]
MRPERHRFVILDKDWRQFSPDFAACLHRDESRQHLAGWIDGGGPLVVASSHPTDAEGTVRLGLATPDKQRLGLTIATEAIHDLLPALTLAEARAAAPEAWQPRLSAILALAEDHGFELGLFGSLAWQTHTGRTYLHPASDLDLLIRFASRNRHENALRALLSLDGQPRLDGEVLLCDGGAVNLRELATNAAELMEKRHGGPRLVPRDEVLGRLGGRE